MARVKSKGNKTTELKLIKIFRLNKITGWRRNFKLIGTPDFVFPKSRLTVFVDGCFWHGHPVKCRVPRGNRSYWMDKINANKARDKKVNKALRRLGWSVLRIWEHEVGKPSTAEKIKRHLANNEQMGG